MAMVVTSTQTCTRLSVMLRMNNQQEHPRISYSFNKKCPSVDHGYCMVSQSNQLSEWVIKLLPVLYSPINSVTHQICKQCNYHKLICLQLLCHQACTNIGSCCTFSFRENNRPKVYFLYVNASIRYLSSFDYGKNKRVGQEELLIDIASLAMKTTANQQDGKSWSTKQAALDQLEIYFGLCQGSHIVTNSGLNSRNLIKQSS